jgi:hypothetical protein
MHTKTKALVGTVALGLALQASAATTTQAISGAQTNNENGCVDAIGIFTNNDCSYGAQNRWGWTIDSTIPDTTGWEVAPFPPTTVSATVSDKPGRVWIGPLANQMYYAVGASPLNGGSGAPEVGDNKVELGLSGVLTIDDNGTTEVGSDDLISGTIVIAAGTRNILTGQGNNSRVEESWDTLTQTLDPTTVNSAIPNAGGGFDYVIASQGMPDLLQPDGSKNNQAYPSEIASSPIETPIATSGWVATDSQNRSVASFECVLASPQDAIAKYRPGRGGNRPRPPAVVLSSPNGMECADAPNFGMLTTGVFSNYSCVDNDGVSPCRINGAILGTPGNFFTPPGNPGYQNLQIAVSTDAGGHIVSSFAFYSHEYQVLQGLFGFDTPYEGWDGGTLTIAGAVQAGSVEVNNDINPKSNGVISVNLYSNDNFDATQATNLAFGPGAADITHNSAHAKDLNGDGVDDLQMHFRQKDAALACGDTSASLTGNTGGGDPFATSAPVLVKCD